MVDANRTIEERLDKIERLLTRGQKQSRRDLGLLAAQANLTDFGMTALLCGACVLVVGGVKIGAELRATAKENMPAWAYNAIWGWAGDFAVAGDLAVDGISSGEYASPIVGKSLQDLVSYQPSHGQSFGPETGNMRSYGPHAGVDFDCRVGGCTGADVASPISGTVSRVHQIGTSANGGSFQLEITGEDWGGKVTHQLVHVYDIAPRLGEYVRAGQVVAKVSPTDTASTGPHLDWKIQRAGQWENPQKWADKAMEQNAISSKGDDDFVSRYVRAIAVQESGASYTAVNPDSGALGKYQFMPATLASTAQSCPGVGNVPSRTEFLGNPDLQDTIMGCYTDAALPTIQAKASDENTQCRMLASYHYSGNPDNYNSTRPQSYAGNTYPSIAAYTKAVCRGF